jgi:hypothetical protein
MGLVHIYRLLRGRVIAWWRGAVTRRRRAVCRGSISRGSISRGPVVSLLVVPRRRICAGGRVSRGWIAAKRWCQKKFNNPNPQGRSSSLVTGEIDRIFDPFLPSKGYALCIDFDA